MTLIHGVKYYEKSLWDIWGHMFRLTNICLVALIAVAGVCVPAHGKDMQPNFGLGYQSHGSQSILVADSRLTEIDIKKLIPTQDALAGLVTTGPYLKMVFDQYQTLNAEISDGYWTERFYLTSGMKDGSRLVLTRKSQSSLRVEFEGSNAPVYLEQGATYTFVVRNGRWQVMNVQSPQPVPSVKAPAPQSGGMNVAQSETFYRKKWYAVKLDNSWYAITNSPRYQKQSLFVRFDPGHNCNGFVGYDYPGKYNPPASGAYPISIRLNTGRKTWTVDKGGAMRRYDPPSDSVIIEFDANMKFITALARQNSVKIGFGDGNDYYDQLSLSGSWASIEWALDQCRYDLRFGSRNQKAPAPIVVDPFCNACEPPQNTTRNELDRSAQLDSQGANGYYSEYTFYNSFGAWHYRCNGQSCARDNQNIQQSGDTVPFAGTWSSNPNQQCNEYSDGQYWGDQGGWGGHEWGCTIPPSARTVNGFSGTFSCGAEGEAFTESSSVVVANDGKSLVYTNHKSGESIRLYKCNK